MALDKEPDLKRESVKSTVKIDAIATGGPVLPGP